jgi:hypothetical protein
MVRGVIALFLQVAAPVLVFGAAGGNLVLFTSFGAQHGGGFVVLTMIFLLVSPWVFFIDEVRDIRGLKIAAIAVVVASYLLFLLLIPALLAWTIALAFGVAG